MSAVLVTGGAGYIGAHACRQLAAAGHRPVAFDNFSTGWRDAVRYGPLIEGDLLNPSDLERAFASQRIDAVMHFAARSQVSESMSSPELYWRNNLCGSLNLFEAMNHAGVHRIVFSSTAAVYGEPCLDLVPETAPLVPTSTYGATKLATERVISDFVRAHEFRAFVFRYFNVAGAARNAELGEQHRPETHLLPLVIEVAMGKRPSVVIFGTDYATPDGTCIRDFIHVEDLVTAHLVGLERLLGSNAGLGESSVYNLGIGRGYSVAQAIERVKFVMESSVPVVAAARRQGDPTRLVCDPVRAQRDLGWTPRHNIDAMIRDAWDWQRRGGFKS